jgi:predicted nuclease of predicted toxin-antitoxin system
MSLALYMDVHIRHEITRGLRLRQVDVLTAQEDGMRRAADPLLLDRATALNRVLFTNDEDLLREGARRQQAGEVIAGVIYAHQLYVSVGQCVKDLELIAKSCDPVDLANQVWYLPL